jgi:hypothetical protein
MACGLTGAPRAPRVLTRLRRRSEQRHSGDGPSSDIDLVAAAAAVRWPSSSV